MDQAATDAVRNISAGVLPSFEISPSNPWVQWMQSNLSKFLPRERFTNFKGLLEDHIGFNEIESMLDYPSKLSRNPDLIHKMMEDGERQGQKLLAGLSEPAHTVGDALEELRKER